MKITKIDIYKFSIPMHPFTIATGTMTFAQNIFIRVHTNSGFYGVGECSAFPMIVGETQNTCYEMAKDFSKLWIDKNPLEIENRMAELHLFTALNATIKSAFDMALYDISAKNAKLPLYQFLGGKSIKPLQTDLTIGIDTPEIMAKRAVEFKNDGVKIIKVKLGKNAVEDVDRIKQIRKSVGDEIRIRIDANQGWSFEDAKFALTEMEKYNVDFCEQPMRTWFDYKLPELKKAVKIPIMADESVFNHYDAERLIKDDACTYVNIKFAKSGGILGAIKINEVCESHKMPCMMGGMLESRIALSAFAHFALAHENVVFYDMDTCLLGHKINPVIGGISYNNYFVEIADGNGIAADADNDFLKKCEMITIQ